MRIHDIDARQRQTHRSVPVLAVPHENAISLRAFMHVQRDRLATLTASARVERSGICLVWALRRYGCRPPRSKDDSE